MFNSSNARVSSIAVHYVGNKKSGETVKLSNNILGFSPDNPVSEILKRYFFDSFKPDVQYRFDVPLTEASKSQQTTDNPTIFKIVQDLFQNPHSLLDNSVALAELLFQHSDHPKIKGGELYVALLNDIKIGDETVNGIGIFKSEHKETYLKVFSDSTDGYRISKDEGINIKKLDKGAIILNTDAAHGYLVAIVDIQSKEREARFWKDDFLRLIPREDDFYFTHNYLDVCKGFVSDVFTSENNAEKTEQIDLLTRSFDFFSKNETFEIENFENDVMGNEEVVEAFQQYRANYFEEKRIPPENNFQISSEAVKKQKRFFKPVIKLDRNFHVYVHGNNSLIERGYDKSKGMNYYQLFFDSES